MAKQPSLSEWVDKAIAEHNAAYLANPEAQAEARKTGEMWGAWLAAEREAGSTAVVLPIALAQDLYDLLRDRDPRLPAETLIAMLADHIRRAALR